MALIMKALHNIEIDFSRIYMCIYLYVYIIRALTYNNTYIPLLQLMYRNLTHRTFFSNHVFHVIISITFCFLNLSFFQGSLQYTPSRTHSRFGQFLSRP